MSRRTSAPAYACFARLRQAPGSAPVAAPVEATSVPAAAPGAPATPANSSVAINQIDTPVPAPAAPAEGIQPAGQGVPPAPPAASLPPVPATTIAPGVPPQLTGDDFVTVQWTETHIGTLRTWVPQIETFHFEAMSQAPVPGVGSIGMGTLTEMSGQRQTI